MILVMSQVFGDTSEVSELGLSSACSGMREHERAFDIMILRSPTPPAASIRKDCELS
jgi:hypothetical protein